MPPSMLRNAVVLGLIVAIGPFAIDMYLPALPMISADLGASTTATQMTLMAFFICFGLCQILFGPASDMYGRKPPLYLGLGLYVAGAIGCALSPNVETLIAFRCLQGIGAASVMVIPRAIVRDLYTGIEATRMMALIMLVFSVAPILAPLIGSLLILPFGWQSVFVAVAVIAALGIGLIAVALPETLPVAARVPVNAKNLASGFRALMTDRSFLGLTFIAGCGMASFFSFLAGSTFVYQEHFGLTPMQFSIAFSVNAVGFVGASQFAAKLGGRFGLTRTVFVAVSNYAAFALLHLVVTLAGVDNLAIMMVLIFLTFTNLGLVVPTTMILALEAHGPIAGMASALGGTLQMMTGAVAIAIVSQFSDGSVLPMVTGIAIAATIAFVLGVVTLRGPRVAINPAE